MAAAIPAAIGVGTSLIGGIQGKGAAKKQQQLAEQQRRDLLPLIQSKIAASQYGLGMAPEALANSQSIFNRGLGGFDSLSQDYKSLTGQGQDILNSSLPYLSGAAAALGDLQKFYRPFMFDGQSAIDRFLPSKGRTEQMLAPEFGEINRGFQSASDNIAKFAPRGARTSALAKGDLDRQSQLSETFFKGRQALGDKALGAAFQGASGQQGVAQALAQLGLGKGQLGLGTIGTGQNAMSQALQSLGIGNAATGNLTQLIAALSAQGDEAFNMYNQQANRAFGLEPQANSGKGLGGYLVDLFNNKGVQDKVGGLLGGIFGGNKKKNSILPGTDFNYGYGQG